MNGLWKGFKATSKPSNGVYHCIYTVMREKGYKPTTEVVEDIHNDVWLLALE